MQYYRIRFALRIYRTCCSVSFGKGESDPISYEPTLASIVRTCQEICLDNTPGPREFEASSNALGAVDAAKDDRKLYASAVSLFPLLDPAIFWESQRCRVPSAYRTVMILFWSPRFVEAG